MIPPTRSCRACRGDGWVIDEIQDPDDPGGQTFIQGQARCDWCGGDGIVYEDEQPPEDMDPGSFEWEEERRAQQSDQWHEKFTGRDWEW